MIDTFLSRTNSLRLKIFYELLDCDGIQINKLTQKFQCTTLNLKRNIEAINLDLSYVTKDVYIDIDKNKIINILSNNQNLLYVFTQLAYHYEKKSISFSLCTLVIKSKCTMVQLCEMLNISISHAYREISNTNKLLTDSKIRLAFNTQGYLDFKGDEISIRIFIYHFILECLPEDVWLFPALTKQEATSAVLKIFEGTSEIDKLSLNKLSCLYTISVHRMSKNNYLISKDTHEVIFKFYTFISEDKFRQNSSSLFHKKTKKANAEFHVFNFLVRVFVPSIVPKKYIIEIGKSYERSNKENAKFLLKVLNNWKLQFCPDLSKEHFYHVIYYSTLIFNAAIYFDLGRLSVWNLENIYLKKENTKYLSQINNFMQQQVSLPEILTFDVQFFLEMQLPYISRLLLTFIAMDFQPKVYINISYLRDYSTIFFIQNKLLKIFSEKSIVFTTMNSSADLILVDRSTQKVGTMAEYLLISDIFSDADWNKLLIKIGSLINKKYHSAQLSG